MKNTLAFIIKARLFGLYVGYYVARKEWVGDKGWGEPVFVLESPKKKIYQWVVFLNDCARINEDVNMITGAYAQKLRVYPLSLGWKLPKFDPKQAEEAKFKLQKALLDG